MRVILAVSLTLNAVFGAALYFGIFTAVKATPNVAQLDNIERALPQQVRDGFSCRGMNRIDCEVIKDSLRVER